MPVDFYPLLSRAIRSLDPGTSEARQNVYERTRQILANQLRLNNPERPNAETAAAKLALEDAIRRIESEQAPAKEAISRASLAPENDAIANLLGPDEQIVFSSSDAISWTPFRPRATAAERNQGFLRGQFGYPGMPGAGASMEAIAMLKRRQWKGTKIDLIVLTDRRLLFISKGIIDKTFELDPTRIAAWIEADRDSRTKASQAVKEGWKAQGLLGAFRSATSRIETPQKIQTIRNARTNWHLFRRGRSWIGFAAIVVGIIIIWQLIAHGVMPGSWIILVLVAASVVSRIGPWTGVRLRVAVFEYGTPQVLKGVSGWLLSRDDIQLRTRQDAELLVSLLAPRIKAIADITR